MQPNALFYLVAGVAVVILGLSKGGFAGVGMISTPLLALVIGPIAAAGVIFPILIVQDFIAVAMYRRTFSWQILATLIPGAALGVCLAYVLASAVPGWSVEIVLGAVSFVFAIQQVIHQVRSLSHRDSGHSHAKWLGVLSGMGSGFASMIAHAGTPPFQFYVMPKNLDRDMYVGTSVLFFAATNLMKAPAFLALGQLSVSQLKTTLIFFPLAMISSWLGVRLVRAIDVRKFNFTITLILLGVSFALVSQGIVGFRESRSQRIASQSILHIAALPSGDAAYSLTFLFVRQATSSTIALLH
jgi:uncharacterized membrane protein YfcA